MGAPSPRPPLRADQVRRAPPSREEKPVGEELAKLSVSADRLKKA